MSIAQNELVDLVIQHDSEIETLLAALPQLKQQVEAGIKELSDKEIALAEKRLATAKRDMLTQSATALSLEIATQRDLSRKEMAELRRALLETMIERDESGTNAVRKEMAEQLATMRQNDAALGDQMRTLRAELSTQIKEFAQTQTAPAPLGFADIYQGVLSEGVEYRRGQIWSYNGGTYLAKKDGRGDLPSRTKNALKDATWATIAAPGMSSSRSSPYSPTPTMMVPSAVPLGPITTSGLTMATARLLGRMTAASGAIEELTVGTSLTLSSGSLNAVQDIRATATPMFADLTINSTAGGSVVGSATGGAKGNGTLNCAGLYVNGMPVASSTDTYWSTDTVGIKYTAGVNSTPIGQTTAAAGAFTSLAASGTISGTHLQPLGTADSPTFASPVFTGNLTVQGTGTSSFAGNVGIGTTGPGTTLETASAYRSVAGDAAGTAQVNAAIMTNDQAGVDDTGATLGLGGIYTGTAKLVYGAISGRKGAANDGYLSLYSYKLGVGLTEGLRLASDGNVGIGTTAPATKLDVAGNLTVSGTAVRFSGYGAGALTTDSSGNITAVSDLRMKDIIAPFTTGLSAVRKLTPQSYHWKVSTGLNADDVNVSLIAQDLIAAGISEAVATSRTVPDMETVTGDDGETATRQKVDANGKPLTKRIDATYTVSDRAVIAALVNAIKDLAAQNDDLAARVAALEKK